MNFEEQGATILFKGLEKQNWTEKNVLAGLEFSFDENIFWPKNSQPKISLSWEKSLVLNIQKEGTKRENILGKVLTTNVLYELQKEQFFCQTDDGEVQKKEFWQEWMIGAPSNQQTEKWNQLAADWAAGCVLTSTQAGLLIVGDTLLERVTFEEEEGSKENFLVGESWTTAGRTYQTILVPRALLEKEGAAWKIHLKTAEAEWAWPIKGWASIILKTKK